MTTATTTKKKGRRSTRTKKRRRRNIAGLPEYINASEAAAIIQVRQSKIGHWIETGELPAADVSENPGQGRARWRIRREDLDEFLRQRQPRPTTKPTRRRRKTKKPAGWIEYV